MLEFLVGLVLFIGLGVYIYFLALGVYTTVDGGKWWKRRLRLVDCIGVAFAALTAVFLVGAILFTIWSVGNLIIN